MNPVYPNCQAQGQGQLYWLTPGKFPVKFTKLRKIFFLWYSVNNCIDTSLKKVEHFLQYYGSRVHQTAIQLILKFTKPQQITVR